MKYLSQVFLNVKAGKGHWLSGNGQEDQEAYFGYIGR